VQVVDYGDPTHVHLSSWSHLAHVNESQFFSSIKKMNNITVKKVNSFNHRSLFRPYVLCVAACNNRNIYEITSKAPFTDLVKQMGDIVDLYGKGEVERVFSGSPWTDETIGVRFERYPEKNLFVAFPTFSPQQVMTLVDRGVLMPAGITRHVVYRRKLNVNLPLDYLAITPLEKANEKLQLFLQHRTVRLYEEPVIYFE